MQKQIYLNRFSTRKAALLTVSSTLAHLSWKWWVFAIVVSFVIQFLSLNVILLFYKDQAQIVDYGRLAFNPNSNWSVNWRVAEGKPLLLWSYLGPLIAEVSYQLSGLSSIGPRFTALIGGITASTVAFGWLLVRKVPIYAAFGLSLAFMLDPLFLLSQHIGRMDSWVMTFCLASCWILHKASYEEDIHLNKWRFMAAGSFAGISTLIWPSAIFLFPLILFELIQFKIITTYNWKNLSVKVFYFSVGGVLTLVLLLIPVWESLVVLFGDLTTMVSQNVDSSKSVQNRIFALLDYRLWLKLVKAYVKTFTPVLPLIALLIILIRRDRGFIIVTLSAVAMIFGSLVYEHRALYLLPYFLVISSSAFIHSGKRPLKLFYRKLANIALVILVVWVIGVSLIVRTSLSIMDTTKTDRKTTYKRVASSIGSGDYKVFMGFTYELYFVGRSLGWKLYTPYVQYRYDNAGNWISENDYGPEDKFIELLTQVDYAIFPLGSVNDGLAKQLLDSGLQYSYVIGADSDVVADKGTQRQRWTHKDIFLWYLKGDIQHGPYIYYARKMKNDRAVTKANYETNYIRNLSIK
jgi:hypothetical protein